MRLITRNMKSKNKVFTISTIVIMTAAILGFIHFSNDHIECQNVIESQIGEHGEQISIEKHICKERFNI